MSTNPNPFAAALKSLGAANTSQSLNSANTAYTSGSLTATAAAAWQQQQAMPQPYPYPPEARPDAEVILSCLSLICSVGEDLARRWFRTVFEDRNNEEWVVALNLYKERNHKEDDLSKIINECAKEISL